MPKIEKQRKKIEEEQWKAAPRMCTFIFRMVWLNLGAYSSCLICEKSLAELVPPGSVSVFATHQQATPNAQFSIPISFLSLHC